jgi:germination protein M
MRNGKSDWKRHTATACALLLVICAAAAAKPTSGLQPTGVRAAPTRTVSLYFLRGEKLGVAHERVARSAAPVAAALGLLVRGPSATERASGLASQIPSGSRLRGVTLAGGVASVDLSSRFASGGGSATMFARLAQVVFTATQFPSVHGVRFLLDGRAVTTFSSEGIMLRGPQMRAGYEDVAPPILVEWPAVGDAIRSPLHLAGTANVFEATFELRLLAANGRVLAHRTVHATCGTGCRGHFRVQVPFTWSGAARGTVVVSEPSAKDGSPTHQVRVPVSFRR